MSQMFVRTVLAAALLALVAPFVLPPVAHAQEIEYVEDAPPGQLSVLFDFKRVVPVDAQQLLRMRVVNNSPEMHTNVQVRRQHAGVIVNILEVHMPSRGEAPVDCRPMGDYWCADWFIGDLAPGEEAIFDVKAAWHGHGYVLNHANLTSDQMLYIFRVEYTLVCQKSTPELTVICGP